jgi:uncharacterized protein YciI
VVELYDPSGGADLDAHLAFLHELRGTGVLVMAGPYDSGHDHADGQRPSGMVILAVPEDQARHIAEADPLVQSGARYVVRRWRRTY